MKFKILSKVSGFTDSEGVQHSPGDVVELPESYKGETWLNPVEPELKVDVPPAKTEAPEVQMNNVEVALEERKLKRKPRRGA